MIFPYVVYGKVDFTQIKISVIIIFVDIKLR